MASTNSLGNPHGFSSGLGFIAKLVAQSTPQVKVEGVVCHPPYSEALISPANVSEVY